MTTPSITIAVLTYLRPQDIGAALPALIDQARRYGPQAQVLVIDNDPRGSAESVVRSFDDPCVRYVIEPTAGIAAARNRALDEISTELLVFIDDDERPTDDWLRELVDQFHAHPGTLGVLGLVESSFESPPDEWLIAGKFFERRQPPSGTEIFVVATNNLLLDRKLLEQHGLRFDPAFGLTGGSDTLFSHHARRQGLSFRFSAEALVYDAVPPERATREWVLKRAYRSGNSWSRTTLAAIPAGPRQIATRIRLSAVGASRLAAGVARVALGTVTRSLSWRAQGMRNLYRGSGMVGGAWGHTYAEYKRP